MSAQVALLGHPVAHSRSPQMHNAAFAAVGLDWHYSAFDTVDLTGAVAALVALGFRGANVTIPHKEAAAALCDEADGDAVNTLIFTAGTIRGVNTDREILAGISATRACLIGAGGAAKALGGALPDDTRTFNRAGAWPPNSDGADLIVNATPITDQLWVVPHPGQTVVDLAYRADGADTALVAAARVAGAEVIDGLEALVRQGAGSFELWTGLTAPLEVMRDAVRRSP